MVPHFERSPTFPGLMTGLYRLPARVMSKCAGYGVTDVEQAWSSIGDSASNCARGRAIVVCNI